MAYEQRDNSGSLFKKDKQGVENRPDYTGPGMVNGELVEISAWIKTSEKGLKFMSLSFKEPYVKDTPIQRNSRPSHDAVKARQVDAPVRNAPQRQNNTQRPANGFDDMDDDIPF